MVTQVNHAIAVDFTQVGTGQGRLVKGISISYTELREDSVTIAAWLLDSGQQGT